ncbi:hypothetical protein [Aquimarina sp. SS2-1]|uniref:hypothetical protein n=1 Tax=Aquimarina besae TaxID=3342247 RepID=UPI00366EF456
MNKVSIILFFVFLFQHTVFAQLKSVIEIGTNESMSIAGKGPGQDAVNNPYLGEDSNAIIENIGQNEFTIRIQEKEKIVKMTPLKSGQTKEFLILKNQQLYFDSNLKTTVKIAFKQISK